MSEMKSVKLNFTQNGRIETVRPAATVLESYSQVQPQAIDLLDIPTAPGPWLVRTDKKKRRMSRATHSSVS